LSHPLPKEGVASYTQLLVGMVNLISGKVCGKHWID